MKNDLKKYAICNVTKRMVKNTLLMSELVIVEPKINELIVDTLSKKGQVVGLKSEKTLKLVYLFNLKDGDYEETKKIIVPELNTKIVKYFEDALKLEPQPLFSDMTIYIALGASYGLMFGNAFKNMFLGMLLGTFFGVLYGLLISYLKKQK